MNFIGTKHEERFKQLMKRGKGVALGDMSRIPVMYILSGNENLYRKAEKIYDFSKGYFKLKSKYICGECRRQEIEWEASMSSSEERLTTLAFDIFSGSSNVGICELFRVLDRSNTQLALHAISLAYV